MPYVSGPMAPRVESEAGARAGLGGIVEQQQRHAGGVAAEHGEVHAVPAFVQAKRERFAAADFDRVGAGGGRRGCLIQRLACAGGPDGLPRSLLEPRSEEHTSELQSLMRISYACF